MTFNQVLMDQNCIRVELLFTRDKPCMVFDPRSDERFFPLNLVAIMLSAKYSAQITVLSGVFVCWVVCLFVYSLLIKDTLCCIIDT